MICLTAACSVRHSATQGTSDRLAVTVLPFPPIETAPPNLCPSRSSPTGRVKVSVADRCFAREKIRCDRAVFSKQVCYVYKRCSEQHRTIRVANSTVEYSAFNRLVLGSNPRRPIFLSRSGLGYISYIALELQRFGNCRPRCSIHH